MLTAVLVKVEMDPVPFFTFTMIKIVFINCEFFLVTCSFAAFSMFAQQNTRHSRFRACVRVSPSLLTNSLQSLSLFVMESSRVKWAGPDPHAHMWNSPSCFEDLKALISSPSHSSKCTQLLQRCPNLSGLSDFRFWSLWCAKLPEDIIDICCFLSSPEFLCPSWEKVYTVHEAKASRLLSFSSIRGDFPEQSVWAGRDSARLVHHSHHERAGAGGHFCCFFHDLCTGQYVTRTTTNTLRHTHTPAHTHPHTQYNKLHKQLP